MTDDRHLVPPGSFGVRSSGRAQVMVPLPASVARYRYFDVSLQTISGGTGHSRDSFGHGGR